MYLVAIWGKVLGLVPRWAQVHITPKLSAVIKGKGTKRALLCSGNTRGGVSSRLSVFIPNKHYPSTEPTSPSVRMVKRIGSNISDLKNPCEVRFGKSSLMSILIEGGGERPT